MGNGVESFVYLWKRSASKEDFLSRLHELEISHPYTLSFLAVLSSDNSIFFNKSIFTSTISNIQVDIEKKKSDSVFYSLKSLIGRKKQEEINGKLIIFKENDGVVSLFSMSNREFIDRCILRFVKISYPQIVQPVIRQENLQEVFLKLQSAILPHQIRIKKYSSKRWLVPKNFEKKKQIASRIDWGKLSIEEAFMEAKEEGKWFTSVAFKLFEERNGELWETIWDGTIYKRGVFLANRWFPQYSKVIIPYLLSIAKEKANLYKNRSRRETKSKEIRPLVIKFDERVFDEERNSREFINILEKIPHFGYSVIHANPYIHMSLLDYRDGSSFEILVHEPDRVVIYPQIRTSSISLEKVVSYISEKFKEGEVADLNTEDE